MVGKRRGREIEKPLLVTIRYVATNEASQRLSHALRILLQAAERNHTASGKSMVAKDEKLTLYTPSEEGAEKGQQDA